MLDRPWVRLVVGALAAALLGAMAARVALSSAGGGPDAGAAAVAASGGRSGGGGPGAPGSGSASGRATSDGAGSAGGASATLPAGTGRVTVHVTGEVRRPGVYVLAEGARVDDAVRRAGGATPDGDRQGLNLAAAVRDGQQVRVPPAAGTAGAAPAAGPGAGDAAGPVDLNTASVEELQTLDGVGEATAAKIVQLREERGGIGGVDDLDEIPGIGAKKLEALRAQLEP